MPPSIALEASHKEGIVVAGQFDRLVETFSNFELMILDLSDDNLSINETQLKLRQRFLDGRRYFPPGYLAFELDSKRYILFFDERGVDSKGQKKDFEHLEIWEMIKENYQEAEPIDAGLCNMDRYFISFIGSARNIGIDRVKYPLEATRGELASDLGCRFSAPFADLEKLPF